MRPAYAAMKVRKGIEGVQSGPRTVRTILSPATAIPATVGKITDDTRVMVVLKALPRSTFCP